MQGHSVSELAAGSPVCRWLVIGPFIIETPGHFEREYLYEREKILDADYFASASGETQVRPEAGAVCENPGIGPRQLAWRALETADLNGNRLAGGAIYETVQRNCVFYAAACIEAEQAGPALLDAYHSGMKAWVNGELVCNEPYGLPKGVRLTMPSKPIQLKKGSNLLLLKFRPGYIADGIDFRVRNVRVWPMASGHGLPIALGRVRPTPHFTGSIEAPRQVIEAAILNTSSTADRVEVTCASDTLGGEDRQQVLCEPHGVTVARLSLPTPPQAAGKPVAASCRARLYGREIEMPFQYEAAEPPKYDGTGMILTSFHFDTTYHEEQRVYAMGAFDIVRHYCRLHREDPNFRSTISEIDYLKPYLDMFPEDRETLMAAFRENRANSDCMYNQPNEQNCGDEALVRNFVYGQLFTGGVLGRPCRVYSPEDVFGHPNQLSQIARKSGCIGVMWGKAINNFPPFFEHLSLDGIGLPHQRGWATWDDVHDMGLSVNLASADQTPPTDWHADLMPEVRQATREDVHAEITRQCQEADAHLPVTTRDMSLYHAATAMSRTNLKVANRLGENLLLMAERFAAVAALLGAEYPDAALDKAWRQLLCGQHHDSITGTHNEISYVDLMNAYRETLELAADVLDRSLDAIGMAIDAGQAEQPLVVFNPLAWQRTDVVRRRVEPKGMKELAIVDHAGKKTPFEAADIKRGKKGQIVSADITFLAKKTPSLGYRTYQLVPAKKTTPGVKPQDGYVIENEFYRVEVDPARGGGIAKLYDKEAKREVLDAKKGHTGNELAVLQEVPDRAETQHEWYTTGLAAFSSNRPADVTVKEGPVSATVRARYRMAEICDVTQEITLYKGVKRVEFKTILEDYQGEDNLFCVTFPTALRNVLPVFDERFGAVVRNDSKGYLDFRTHRQIMFSDCAVYAANKWVDYGPSSTVQAGRNKYPLGMVGLIAPKSGTGVAEDIQRAFIRKGVTCTPWLDAGGPYWGTYQYHMDEDLLYTRFRLSLGSRGRNAYTKELLSRQSGKTRKAFEKRLGEQGYAFLLVEDAEHLDTPQTRSWPATPVLIVEAKGKNELEEAVDALLNDFAETGNIKLPGEIDAVDSKRKIRGYGVALLNEGTYANSVERDGVLCMMLTHTCRWYGGTSNFEEGYLVPENRNHVFRYALYPHAGDWREAGVPQAGHEFNFPLLARQTQPSKKACLPPEEALVEVAPSNVILSALKPFGNPMAAFQKDRASDPSEGLMARVYEVEGRDAEARLRFAAGEKEAWTANLLEERQEPLEVDGDAIVLPVGAGAIETVGFVPGKLGRKVTRKSLGASSEPVQPVWVRSWEHDAESMPMGYHGAVCSIGRDVVEEDGGRMLRIKVNAVNDHVDGGITLAARLIVPEGWRVDPGEMKFELDALAHAVLETRVTRPDPDAKGQIKLRYELGGQTFQDVLEIGGAFELEMTANNEGDAVVVTVHNPNAGTVEGEVSLVTPLEAWPADVVGDYGLLEITPRTQAVSLAPGDSEVLRFKVEQRGEDGPPVSYWAVAKLMSNGRITLKRCGRRPARRTLDDAAWLDSYRERAAQYEGQRKKG